MTVGVYDNCYTCWYSCPTNASDKGGTLHGADPDSLRLASYTRVADIDIIVARGEIAACAKSQCDVKLANCIARERTVTHGRVLGAGSVLTERPHTVRYVEVTGCVEKERRSSRSRVVATSCVEGERIPTGGRVSPALCVVLERSNTGSRVVVAGCVGHQRRRTDGRIPTPKVAFERAPTDGRVADARMVQERVLTEEGVKVDGIAAFLAIRSRLRRKPRAGEHERC